MCVETDTWAPLSKLQDWFTETAARSLYKLNFLTTTESNKPLAHSSRGIGERLERTAMT